MDGVSAYMRRWCWESVRYAEHVSPHVGVGWHWQVRVTPLSKLRAATNRWIWGKAERGVQERLSGTWGMEQPRSK